MRKTKWPMSSPARRDKLLRAVLEAQKRTFRRRFGRAPKPSDPIFFDPDAKDPKPLTIQRAQELTLRALRVADMPKHFLYAYEKTGLIVAAENKAFFTSAFP